MKYLILCTLFLVGCEKVDSEHERQRVNILLKAEKFCKCHGGILSVDILKLNYSEDKGSVRCIDGSYHYEVQQLEYIDQSCGNKGK